MREDTFETNQAPASPSHNWSFLANYLNEPFLRLMKWVLFFGLFTYFGCDDVLPSDTTIIDTNALAFFTVSTTDVTRTPILTTVELTGEINAGNCQCLEEVGFFYSLDRNALFQESLSFQDLMAASNVTQVEVPEQNIELSNGKQFFSYTVELPIVDTTYFFRSYGIFHDNSESQNLERTHLSQETTPIQVTLKNGWYKETFIGDLWARKGAFVVDNPTGGKIVGLGCSFPSFCRRNIEAQPFLKLEFNRDSVEITAQPDCPYDFDDVIYNRQDPVAFRLNELVYFGTGLIDNTGTNDFYAYNPADCFQDPITIDFPEGFTARTGAVGFSMGDYGYVGLGKKFEDKFEENIYIDEPLGDFWCYNPEINEWCPMTLEGDLNFANRNNAIIIRTYDGSIIFGGGQGAFGAAIPDFWKFTPDPINCTAIIEAVPGPPSLGIDGDGISFTINNIPYVGLGNLHQEFFKLQDGNWTAVAPFPGTSISSGVGFSKGNRGYLFTGIKNDNTLTNLSRDLWIYVPE